MKKLVVSLTLLTAACGNSRNDATVSASTPVAALVPLVRIEAQPFAATVAITGTLVSRSTVDVKAETTGRVVRFPKQEGESVKAGEPVVWIDDENYTLGLTQSTSAVAVAEAALERAKIAAAHSRSELERAHNLLNSGGITDRDLKSAEVADKDARAQVSLAEAQLEQARAAVLVARKRVRDTIIHAPVDGEIQKRHVNPGAYVEPPTAVFTLVDNQRLELEAPVPAADLAGVRAGQNVTFAINSYPGLRFSGRVVEISPAVEALTRSARVRIAVDNRAQRLRAGMFAEGEIITGTTAHSVIIPAAAVYRDDRSARTSFVYVAENGRAMRRQVRIGRERNSSLEIVEGLNPGDLLIAEQSIEIGEGTPVEARR